MAWEGGHWIYLAQVIEDCLALMKVQGHKLWKTSWLVDEPSASQKNSAP